MKRWGVQRLRRGRTAGGKADRKAGRGQRDVKNNAWEAGTNEGGAHTVWCAARIGKGVWVG